MTREDAPASTYLQAVPNCSLSCVCIRVDAPARNIGTVVAINCKSGSVPTAMHVGRVFGRGQTCTRMGYENT